MISALLIWVGSLALVGLYIAKVFAARRDIMINVCDAYGSDQLDNKRQMEMINIRAVCFWIPAWLFYFRERRWRKKALALREEMERKK